MNNVCSVRVTHPTATLAQRRAGAVMRVCQARATASSSVGGRGSELPLSSICGRDSLMQFSMRAGSCGSVWYRYPIPNANRATSTAFFHMTSTHTHTTCEHTHIMGSDWGLYLLAFFGNVPCIVAKPCFWTCNMVIPYFLTCNIALKKFWTCTMVNPCFFEHVSW